MISFDDIVDKAWEAAYSCIDNARKETLFKLLCNFMNENNTSKRDTSFLGLEYFIPSNGIEKRKRRRNDS